ncbi:hypothetical protein FJD32_021855 [Shewanella sp. LC6]|uniref:hypothetical protein n=1 Tax=unclassified Shewanella TaxID=196818 RepID=UPI00112E6118|nr:MULTISPECIES: hypothetical protein [unclassified Shewanella]QQK61897.1 hypothetical protein FJD32_021855 [Shewanella sp. LC6]TPE54034.1 hypothetical protein FJD33_18010 [Shewanella sp. LC2]
MSILPLSVRLSVLISLLIIVFPSSASVVMTNTRVIYPSDAKERSAEESPDDLQINHQIRVEAHLVA